VDPAGLVLRVSLPHGFGVEFGDQPIPIPQPTSNSILDHRSGHGAVVGGGVEMRAGFLRLSPEFRYTRWAADAEVDPYLHSNQNEMELLLGLALKAR